MASVFAGVSVIADSEVCYCTEPTAAYDAGTGGRGYHLLVVNGYSGSREDIETGQNISSRPFQVGGHRWCVRYYPNGENTACSDFVSLHVFLVDAHRVAQDSAVEAWCDFSFVNEADRQRPSYIRAGKLHRFSKKTPTWGRERFVERRSLEPSANLRRDCLTIRCDIVVRGGGGIAVRDGSAEPDIALHFQSLLQSKVGADVSFEVGGKNIAAHRCMLAARSTVFMAQLFGPMKEDTTSSVIQIKDMKPRVFRALISFIYTDSLPKMEEEEEGEAAEEVTWLADLFVAADSYDLKQLKSLCEKQLSGHVTVSALSTTLALAERHHCRALKEACFQFLRVQSPSRLQAVMASDGWEYITATYPSVLNELIAELMSLYQKSKIDTS